MAEYNSNVQEIARWILSIYSGDGLFAEHETTLPILQDEEFARCLRSVMYTIQIILRRSWTTYIDRLQYHLLSSHEAYISHVVFACRLEEYSHLNVFERFLVVCGITILFCIDIYYMTDVKLGDLTFDIIMVYYEKYLKTNFNKRGGFERLVEYIGRHKYAKWGMSPENLPLSDATGTLGVVRKDVYKKMQKEFNKQSLNLFSNSDKIEEMKNAESLAREFLSTTQIELPPLPTQADLAEKIRNRDEVVQRKLRELEQLMKAATGSEASETLLQNPVDSAATERALDEEKTEDSAERQRTEVEQKIDILDDAVQELSISDCKPNLDVKSSEFEEAKDGTSSERRPTEEMAQKQLHTDEGLPALPISNSGSKPNEEVEQEMSSAGCENAEQVISNKDSKISRNYSAKNSIRMQLFEILEHLNSSIKSGIDILDQYDKE